VIKSPNLVQRMYATMKRSSFSSPRTHSHFSMLELHVRKSILPLYVLERKWAIRGYLYSILVMLQNYPVALHIPSLICFDSRSVVPFTRFCLRGRMSIASNIRGGHLCPLSRTVHSRYACYLDLLPCYKSDCLATYDLWSAHLLLLCR
jgi:hypothetical protein